MLYTWNTGYSRLSFWCVDDWKRLNSCKAAMYHVVSECEDSDYYESSEDIFLVSYGTPIMQVRILHYIDRANPSYTFYVNKDYWPDRSRTTITHISKFLNNLSFFQGIDITYQELRQAMKALENKNPFSFCEVKPNYHVVNEPDYSCIQSIRAYCPPYRIL